MSVNLYQAYRQWAIRPADERFSNLDELYNFTETKRLNSSQYTRPLESIALNSTASGDLTVNGSSDTAVLSNWAFNQLCNVIKAPPSYLSELSEGLAIDCLRYGLKNNKSEAKILVRKDPSSDRKLASAFTSPKYGRIWDSEVIENLRNAIQGYNWHVPESKSKDPSGLYASDRDMFVFMIDDDNPVKIGNTKLGKGFFCWNSETGSQTFGFTTFLYNYVCENHIVWGAERVKELKIVHRSNALNRLYSEAIPTINNFVEYNKSTEKIRSTVDKAMNHEIGTNLEQILEWFKHKPFTKKEIKAGYETAINTGENPSQLWGMIQGLTSYAKELPYTDKRVNLEKRAGALLG